MAMPISDITKAQDPTEAATQQMEAAIMRQLLTASGAFKPADVAGGQLRAEMFIETLADAVAKSGGIGIGRMLEEEIEKKGATSNASVGASHGGRISAADVLDGGSDDDDPASFAARKTENGAMSAHTALETTLCAHASQVPVKSGENGTYNGGAHRALNAYQKRAEETVTGTQGPRTGDAP
jgi:Rod binding domain-containing protein